MEPREVWNWVWNCCHLICYRTLETGGGGLNHAGHSPLAANHAANDKWKIRLPLVTMASQGQDLTRIANTNKRRHCCLSEEPSAQSPAPFWTKQKKRRLDASLSDALWNMTLDGWLERKHRGGLQLWRSDEKWSKGSRQQASRWPLLLRQMLVTRWNSTSKQRSVFPAGATTRNISI